MIKRTLKRFISMVLAFCMIFGCASICNTYISMQTADAAAKAKPAVKKLNMTVGEKRTIKIKNKQKKLLTASNLITLKLPR